MGGQIVVRSRVGVGTAFLFTIRCRLPANPQSAEVAEGVSRLAKANSNSLASFHNLQAGMLLAPPSEKAPLGSPLWVEAGGGGALQEGRGKIRILLAEDNKVNVMVALSMLKRLGLEADVACHGGEAIEAIKAKSYDLVGHRKRVTAAWGLGLVLGGRVESERCGCGAGADGHLHACHGRDGGDKEGAQL